MEWSTEGIRVLQTCEQPPVIPTEPAEYRSTRMSILPSTVYSPSRRILGWIPGESEHRRQESRGVCPYHFLTISASPQ